MTPVTGDGTGPCAVRRSVVPGWSELWQIPFFCLGLVSLALSWGLQPPAAQSAPARVQAYEKARLALDQRDWESAKRWLRAVEASNEDSRVQAGQIAFLRGSIELSQALELHPLPLSGTSGRQVYEKVAQTFEAVGNALPPAEQPRLEYRLVLIRIALQGLEVGPLDRLEQVLDTDYADRVEGYELLSRLRVRLQPSDYAGAVRALDRYLACPEIKQPHSARLQKTRWLVELERWNDAAKASATIPLDAVEYREALMLRALSAYHQQRWGEAERAWSQVPIAQLTPRMLLYYGLCRQQMKNSAEAERLWERLRLTFPQSPEYVKALALLADQAARQGRWPEAVSLWTTLLRGRTPKDWSNPYLSLEELRMALAATAESLTKLHRWEDLRLLGDAALPFSHERQVEGWLASAWHAAAETASRGNTTSVTQKEAYRRAAEFAVLAAENKSGTPPGWLDQGGRDALKAEAFALARNAYGQWLALPPEPARRGEVFLGLATALEGMGQLDDARDRYQEAGKLAGPHEVTAHLRLYYLLFRQKQWGGAEAALESAAQFVTRPAPHPDAARAAHERMRFRYSLWTMNRHEILRAIEAGETALRHAEKHPLAAQTHYLLGELLEEDARHLLKEQLAAWARPPGSEPVNPGGDGILRQKAARFWEALNHFQIAERELASSSAEVFQPEYRSLWIRYARFGRAECYFSLGLLSPHAPAEAPRGDACWLEAGKLYAELAQGSSIKLESLHAWYWLAQCLGKRGLISEMQETARTALELMDEMREEDFKSPPPLRLPELARAEWKAQFTGLLNQN